MSLSFQHWLFAMALTLATITLPFPRQMVTATAHGGIPTSPLPSQIGSATASAGTLLVDNGLTGYQMSPDSQYIVYQHSPNNYSSYELYSMPVYGGTAVKLSSTPAVNPFQAKITPDAQHVVYLEFRLGALWTVPISGTVATTQIADSGVVAFQLSNDNQFIIYRTMSGDIYSVAIDGTSPIELVSAAGNPWGTDDADDFIAISPDSQYVVYPRANSYVNNSDANDGLYRIPIRGGTPINLTNIPAPDWRIDQFQISPDSQTVVFKAFPVAYSSTGVRYRSPGVLYSVPLSGGIPVQLADNTPDGTRAYLITPDSDWLVYARIVDDQHKELYSIPLNGGPAHALSPGLLMGLYNESFRMTADGSTIVYVAYTSAQLPNLYSVAVDAGSPLQLNPTSLSNSMSFLLSPDGRFVIYQADLTIPHQYELYRVPVTGGPSRLLNLPIPAGQQFAFYWISPDSRLVVYGLFHYDPKEEPPVISALISASIESNSYVSLKETLVSGNLRGFIFTPDAAKVLYQADEDDDGQTELYSLSTYPLFLTGALKPLHHHWYLPIATP